MNPTPESQLRALHPQVRERLRKLDGMERQSRRLRRDRLHAEAPVDDEGQGEGWMLSYLDLVTLMLVLLVVLVALHTSRTQIVPSPATAPVPAATPVTEARTVPTDTAGETPASTATAQASADLDAPPTASTQPALTGAAEAPAEVARAAALPQLPPATSGPELAAAPVATETSATDTVATAPPAAADPAPAGTVPGASAPSEAAPGGAASTPDVPATLPEPPPAPGPVHLAGTTAPPAPDAPARWTLAGFTELIERHAPPMAATAPASAAEASAFPPPRPLPDLAKLGLDQLGEGIDVIVNDQSVSFRISNEILFPSGQADLVGTGTEVLGRLANAIARLPYPVSVEGHTDIIPIQTNRFPSNWELSTARATSVLRQLMSNGVASDRLRAVGWAHTRPIADNGTATGRATNRRVELIMEVPPGAEAPAAAR